MSYVTSIVESESGSCEAGLLRIKGKDEDGLNAISVTGSANAVLALKRSLKGSVGPHEENKKRG